MPQAQTVDIPKRLPLILQPENRGEDTLKDAKLVNGYVETNAHTQETWIFKRPGLTQTGATTAGVGYGVYNWLGDIYSIFGATMYKNGVALVGALNTAGGVYKFSQSLGVTPRLQFGNGVVNYNYDAGAGIVAMAGANLPTTPVKGIAYLDGTTYLFGTDASIKGCTTINDPTLWTDTLNTIAAQIEADAGVALAKQLVYIVALGEWSTEFFYDQQNAVASPLGPVQGAKLSYGCASADSLQEIDGALIWLATNRSSAYQVVLVDNLKLSVVSTKPIERLLGELNLTTVFSFGLKYEGHRFYGLTSKTSNITLVYDLTEQMWMQWTDTNGNYWPIVSATYSTSLGRVLQHETNGKLYQFDAVSLTDDSTMIPVDLYTPNFDGGTRRKKHLNMMEFVGDQVTGSVMQVRSNDLDYAATGWSNFRQVDFSIPRPILCNNGTFRRRAYHFRHRCNTRFRIQAVELQIDLGTL